VAFVVAVVGTQATKFLAGRARPDQNRGPATRRPEPRRQFSVLLVRRCDQGFVLASVLSEEIGHPAVTIALYSLPGPRPFSASKPIAHWLSDVASAAVWSTAVGITTVRVNRACISRATALP